MWVLKAVNLNRGMCIKVVNSFQQMEKVINKFKSGVDYSNFTLEKIEEPENNSGDNEEENNQVKIIDNTEINKDKEKLCQEDKEEEKTADKFDETKIKLPIHYYSKCCKKLENNLESKFKDIKSKIKEKDKTILAKKIELEK